MTTASQVGAAQLGVLGEVERAAVRGLIEVVVEGAVDDDEQRLAVELATLGVGLCIECIEQAQHVAQSPLVHGLQVWALRLLAQVLLEDAQIIVGCQPGVLAQLGPLGVPSPGRPTTGLGRQQLQWRLGLQHRALVHTDHMDQLRLQLLPSQVLRLQGLVPVQPHLFLLLLLQTPTSTLLLLIPRYLHLLDLLLLFLFLLLLTSAAVVQVAVAAAVAPSTVLALTLLPIVLLGSSGSGGGAGAAARAGVTVPAARHSRHIAVSLPPVSYSPS